MPLAEGQANGILMQSPGGEIRAWSPDEEVIVFDLRAPLVLLQHRVFVWRDHADGHLRRQELAHNRLLAPQRPQHHMQEHGLRGEEQQVVREHGRERQRRDAVADVWQVGDRVGLEVHEVEEAVQQEGRQEAERWGKHLAAAVARLSGVAQASASERGKRGMP